MTPSRGMAESQTPSASGERAEGAAGPPVRIVGVSRVFNEEHLIEAFVRHHAALLHQHIILDNGSVDRTVEILRALKAEGLNLQLYQGEAVVYAESIYNTGLYRLAVQEGADWVVFLDCDEMLDVRRAPEGLGAFLAGVPPEVDCVQMRLVDYRAATVESAAEANPFKRLTRREPEAHAGKVIVRRTDPARVTVAAGNHHAVVDGAVDWGFAQDRVVLAHFPERSPCQAAAKAIVGRLKVLASGQADARLNLSWHYTETFEAMKQAPRAWLAQAEQRASRWSSDADLVHDPPQYLGGELRHTREPDDVARLVALTVSHAEALALSHGRILDAKRLIRADLLRKAAVVRRLF